MRREALLGLFLSLECIASEVEVSRLPEFVRDFQEWAGAARDWRTVPYGTSAANFSAIHCAFGESSDAGPPKPPSLESPVNAGENSLIGLLTGYISATSVYVASMAGFALGSLVGVGLMILKKAGRKSALPFGPFMIAGAIVALWITPWVNHLGRVHDLTALVYFGRI